MRNLFNDEILKCDDDPVLDFFPDQSKDEITKAPKFRRERMFACVPFISNNPLSSRPICVVYHYYGAGGHFSTLPVITGPVKLLFSILEGVSKGLKIVQQRYQLTKQNDLSEVRPRPTFLETLISKSDSGPQDRHYDSTRSLGHTTLCGLEWQRTNWSNLFPRALSSTISILKIVEKALGTRLRLEHPYNNQGVHPNPQGLSFS